MGRPCGRQLHLRSTIRNPESYGVDMRNWTKASGLIFLAAASVYSGQVIGATPAKSAKRPADAGKNTDVKLLEDQADPFASAPTTKPSDASSTTATTPAASAPASASASNASLFTSSSAAPAM